MSEESVSVHKMSSKDHSQFGNVLPYLREEPSWTKNMQAVAEDVQKSRECVPLLDAMCKVLGMDVPRVYLARMEMIMYATIMGTFEPKHLIAAAQQLITNGKPSHRHSLQWWRRISKKRSS